MTVKFLKTDNHIIALDNIGSIDCSGIEELFVVVTEKNTGRKLVATDIRALELVMQTVPSIVEGRNLRAPKRAWAYHNLVSHPLMQILAFLKFYDLAFKVHDESVPRTQRRVK